MEKKRKSSDKNESGNNTEVIFAVIALILAIIGTIGTFPVVYFTFTSPGSEPVKVPFLNIITIAIVIIFIIQISLFSFKLFANRTVISENIFYFARKIPLTVWRNFLFLLTITLSTYYFALYIPPMLIVIVAIIIGYAIIVTRTGNNSEQNSA